MSRKEVSQVEVQPIATEKLKEYYRAFQEKYIFKPGDLVTWKSGMRISRFPKYNEPAIVLEVIDPPVIFETEPNSILFKTPLDLRLGVIDESGDFLTFYYDSRRFQPYFP